MKIGYLEQLIITYLNFKFSTTGIHDFDDLLGGGGTSVVYQCLKIFMPSFDLDLDLQRGVFNLASLDPGLSNFAFVNRGRGGVKSL